MAKAKKFEELTPVGQKRRLALYEKKNADERAKLQKEYAENHDGASIELHDDLATLARPAKLRENSNGSKTAIMTIGILNIYRRRLVDDRVERSAVGWRYDVRNQHHTELAVDG